MKKKAINSESYLIIFSAIEPKRRKKKGSIQIGDRLCTTERIAQRTRPTKLRKPLLRRWEIERAIDTSKSVYESLRAKRGVLAFFLFCFVNTWVCGVLENWPSQFTCSPDRRDSRGQGKRSFFKKDGNGEAKYLIKFTPWWVYWR